MPSLGDPTLAERLQVVERLVQLFRMERIVHLLVTTISLAMLLTSAALLIYRSGAETGAHVTALTGLFGASGLITYSANRLLRMWDQALHVLQVSKGQMD